jgi:deoxyribose-phosphate aldolase
MSSELIDNIVDQVFKERSLLEKLCFKGGKCIKCGKCAIPGAVKSSADVVATQRAKNIVNNEKANIASLPNSKKYITTSPRYIGDMIDHTLLRPCAIKEEIIKLCEEAKNYSFASACVNLCWVKTSAQLLRGSKVKVCSVVGFPFGATSTDIKVAETKEAISDGATEIDMVINIGELKSDNKNYVLNDIQKVANCCKRNGALLKVIIETGLLTDEEKVIACLITKEAGADFVKTSTGFNCGGATIGDIALMRKVVGPDFGVKASGGIKTLEDALAMIQSGANRLGTSSGIKIISEITNR